MLENKPTNELPIKVSFQLKDRFLNIGIDKSEKSYDHPYNKQRLLDSLIKAFEERGKKLEVATLGNIKMMPEDFPVEDPEKYYDVGLGFGFSEESTITNEEVAEILANINKQ